MTIKAFALLTLCAAITGCISLLPEAGPGPDIYRLSDVSAGSDSKHTELVILLPLVQAQRELKNNRLTLVRHDRSIAYAADARWAAPTPQMLRKLIADTLTIRAGIRVVAPADGVDTAIELRVGLTSFEALYDQGTEAAPLAVVRYQVQIIDRKSRTLLAQETFRATSRANDIRLGQVVNAIDLAAHSAASKLSDWVAQQSALRDQGGFK